LNKLLQLTEFFSRICAWFCGLLLLGTVFLIAVEVMLRKFFAVSMGGADEISSYVLALVCTWSLGYTLFQRGHVRIDVLYCRLPVKLQAVLDILALAAFLLYMLFLSYFAFFVLKTSVLRGSTANTPLQTPLWIPQSLWFLGLIIFTLVIMIILFAAIYYLFKGRLQSVRDLAGASAKEIEERDKSGKQS
jgi:TRAP-type C4-dicarboxylate transport system permease small subunit